MKISRSEELFKKALRLIPGGVNSPVRAFKAVGTTPIYMQKGEGAYVFDIEGNKYIDFCMSWGPLILGHANPEIIEAVEKVLRDGFTFGTCHPLEVEMADIITSNIPFCEKIRMVSSGTEATMSAIRVARGYTKRPLIVKFEGCYHGHSDGLLVKAGSGLKTFSTPSSNGVPDCISSATIVLPLDDDEALKNCFEKHGNDIAAVIIEPIPANNGLLIQRKEFLKLLRDITQKYSTLLIADEVISGFRVGFGGACGYYDIAPDLVTYGKIIGGGFPLAAYGGRAKIMDKLSPVGDVYQAGTLSGNPIALAAGIRTLEILQDKSIYTNLEKTTNNLAARIESIASKVGKKLSVFKIGSLIWIYFGQKETIRSSSEIESNKMEIFKNFFAKMLNNGVYLPPSGYEVCFLSTYHDEKVINALLKAFENSL